MIKLKKLLTEAPQIKKVKNVSVQYFGAEYAGEMAFSGYFRKAWLYEKDNGEWFAIVITKSKNRYQIELGKHKNKLSADKAAEKIIKRNLNKFESVNEKMNPRRYSEIKGQAKYLTMEIKTLNKGIKSQNDKGVMDSIDYILSKAKMMKEILTDKRYD